MIKIANGVYKITLGTPEEFTLVSVLKPKPRFERLNEMKDLPCRFSEKEIRTYPRKGSYTVELPLGREEHIYGFGLMLKSFEQTGLKKKLRSNSDPTSDTGDSHAPVPFYVSTEGYGVLVDTARYVTFYAGNCKVKGSKQEQEGFCSAGTEAGHWWIKKGSGNMFIDIPAAEGVDLYVFEGESLLEAVAKYNLFSGGGCFVPLWGLGVMYRAWMPGDQEHILQLAKGLREDRIPCDIFGLEPGWQTHAYSCTYEWNKEKFPEHEKMLRDFREMGYKVNLWEEGYVHPDSPIFEKIYQGSSDCYVWDGLVPDFTQKETVQTFQDWQHLLMEEGVYGFKLDEGDNSDFTANWGFPDFAKFPSGMDGEQMHTVFGSLFQRVMLGIYEDVDKRTFGESRQSTAFAAPMPYGMYSDLYDHRDFVRGMASAACSGLLWTPEVRQADSAEELLRRIAATVVSPQAVINAFMVPLPPWKQFDYDKNLAGEELENAKELTDACRKLLEIRMQLIPHLYTAYYRYYEDGIPPVRPLVMDYPLDNETYGIYDEYMLGNGLLAAPVICGEGSKKRVYLPEGKWYRFTTGEVYEGRQFYELEVALDEILLFVKEGTLLALAKPLLYIPEDVTFEIALKMYGDGNGSCELICDDGVSNRYKVQGVEKMCICAVEDGYTVTCENTERYRIISYERIGK